MQELPEILDRVILPANGQKPRQIIVLLHGYGADGQDLLGLAPHLQQFLPDAAFVAPDAPFPCEMSPFGRQWFSLIDRTPSVVAEKADEILPHVATYLEAVCQRFELGMDQMALVGFSQGTMMSLRLALQAQQQMKAVVGSALLGADVLTADQVQKSPMLLIHGDSDDVVPVESTHEAVEVLGRLEVPVQKQIRPNLGHGIDPDGLMMAGKFLQEAFI